MPDLPQHLGRHIEHRLHARRIGLLQRPGRLRRKIAIGVGDDLPDRIERPVDRIGLMLRPAFAEQRRRRIEQQPGLRH